jgi:hypothetical protein
MRFDWRFSDLPQWTLLWEPLQDLPSATAKEFVSWSVELKTIRSEACPTGAVSRRVGASVGSQNAQKVRAARFVSDAIAITRRCPWAILVLFTCVSAYANPVSVNPQSMIAFGIVAFWALVVESGLATLVLVSSGVLIVPYFGTLFLANVSVFLFAFLPLSQRASLWLLEPGVLLVDGLLIKLLSSAPFLQGGDFVGFSWRRALIASLLGNGASYFIGLIGSHEPWYIHE